MVALAWILRGLHLRAMASRLLDTPPEVGMDRWLAMHVAEAVARGDWLGGWAADYDSTLGYSYWLAALYALGGGWLAPLVVQALLGGIACALVAMAGARLWSPFVGVAAAVLLAAYAPALFYETLLVKFALIPVAVATVLLCTTLAAERRTPSWAVASGVALGTLMAIRGNAALVAPVCAWWMVRGRARGAGRMLLAFAAGVVLVFGPLALRDRVAARAGRSTSLWGIHFYVATHAGADGTYAPVPGVRDDAIGHVVDARSVAETDAGRALSGPEVSRWWLARGLDDIRRDPWRYVVLQARKVRLVLAGHEDGAFGDDFDGARATSWILRLPLVTFGAICPLALLGAAIVLERRRAELLPWFVGAYLLSLLPFFVTGRYRLPIAVPMLLLAAVGMEWIANAVRAHRWPMLVAAAAFLALTLFGLPTDIQDRCTFLLLLALGTTAAATVPRQSTR